MMIEEGSSVPLLSGDNETASAGSSNNPMAAAQSSNSGSNHGYRDNAPGDESAKGLDHKTGLVTTLSNGDASFEGHTDRTGSTEHGLLETIETQSNETPQYRVYKRRFFGLAQLVLLNIMISWNWLTFASVSSTSARFFGVDVATVNWLSTVFLFAFVPTCPVTIWALNRMGPKSSILIGSVLTLVGNWIRYGGVRTSPPSFAAVTVGQILIGFAQPFVLAAPTRYSNLWFSDAGRVSATAVASLANPFGAALGELIGPFWATKASELPNMILYVAIISSVVTIPAIFIPRAPPTPPSALAESERFNIREALHVLPRNASFWLIFIPFSVYVGFFNATSSLLNQILFPYNFSETEAGIAGGLLIIVGIIAAAIVSPWIDRTRKYTPTIKVLAPLIGVSYLVFIFMPATRNVAGPYIVCAILGATSFSLLPCVLEYMVLVTHPVSPEVSSTISWAGGQLLGAIFIVIMDALQGGWGGEPKNSMTRALIFQAVLALIVVPLPMWLGVGERKNDGIANRDGRLS